ncbi:beta-defensin 104A-like [Meles meles]|uniref:beta-defensin 104A-like n=1 Tax=Meles meles TaxID=9662 RepID=UPI001E69B20F|nr:beta-defensin 104A-like [Meles meles]
MRTFLFLFALLFLPAPVRSEFDIYKICGYGTARCRSKCKVEEFQIGACPNAYPCCLKKRTL